MGSNLERRPRVMKIVVVKSPRLLSGLFRMIFKISKETPEES